MCNIAGYVGKRRAAPILIDMLRREEGIDAGYYTGIATVHEGKIHYRKLTGDLDTLLKNTDAADLPGNIGIIHGRTKSGGPDAWSHPFVSGGKYSSEPTVAYVANGNSGIFKSRDPEYTLLAEKLIEEGYHLDSEIELDDGIYNRLSNGKMVHMSDIMCAIIAKEIDLGREPSLAMANAFSTMPGDIVGLMLSLKTPDRIVWSKISRPMTVSFSDHGAYLATTAIAHPDDALTVPVKLPTLSSGYVTETGFTADGYRNPPAPVISADLGQKARIYDAVVKALSEGEKHIYELNAVVREFLGTSDSATVAATQESYDVLEALHREKRLETVNSRVPAVIENMTAPYTKFKLIK